MTDPIADIIGDYRAFAAQQRDRMLARGIDIAPYPLSHLAFRVPEWDQYLHVRALLERHARELREGLERPADLANRAQRAARGLRRQGGSGHRAHPAGPPARVQDGP